MYRLATVFGLASVRPPHRVYRVRHNYIVTERNNAVNTLAKDEDLDASVLNHYLSEYDYLQKEQPEIIQEALKEKHLGLIKRRKAFTRIMDKLRTIIKVFNWE